MYFILKVCNEIIFKYIKGSYVISTFHEKKNCISLTELIMLHKYSIHLTEFVRKVILAMKLSLKSVPRTQFMTNQFQNGLENSYFISVVYNYQIETLVSVTQKNLSKHFICLGLGEYKIRELGRAVGHTLPRGYLLYPQLDICMSLYLVYTQHFQ